MNYAPVTHVHTSSSNYFGVSQNVTGTHVRPDQQIGPLGVYCGGPQSETGTYNDVFGYTVLTTTLTTDWQYNYESIPWCTNPPQFTTSPSLAITWTNSIHVGIFKENRYNKYQAYGSGDYTFGIPTPWGTIGFNQLFDSTINMYNDGQYQASYGSSYITS